AGRDQLILDAVDASPVDLADFDCRFHSLRAGSVELRGGHCKFSDPPRGSWARFDVEVTAGELGISTIYDEAQRRRAPVAPDEVLVDATVDDAAGAPGGARVLDGARAPQLHGGRVAMSPRVDNGNTVSLSADALNERPPALAAELGRGRPRWNELERAQPGPSNPRPRPRWQTGAPATQPAAGLEAARDAPPRRAGALTAALAAAEEHGQQVHCFSALRPGLSAFGDCRDFEGSGPPGPVVRLPPGAAAERRAAAGLIFLACDRRRRTSPGSPTAPPGTGARGRGRQRCVAADAPGDLDPEICPGRAAGMVEASGDFDAGPGPGPRRAVARRRRVELEIGAPPAALPDEPLAPRRRQELRRGAWPQHPRHTRARDARAAAAAMPRAAADSSSRGKE
ncbi:unnamed protein product, partial [Prorocentrum cordatum]